MSSSHVTDNYEYHPESLGSAREDMGLNECRKGTTSQGLEMEKSGISDELTGTASGRNWGPSRRRKTLGWRQHVSTPISGAAFCSGMSIPRHPKKVFKARLFFVAFITAKCRIIFPFLPCLVPRVYFRSWMPLTGKKETN